MEDILGVHLTKFLVRSYSQCHNMISIDPSFYLTYYNTVGTCLLSSFH